MQRMAAMVPAGWQVDMEDLGNEHGKARIQSCNACVSSSEIGRGVSRDGRSSACGLRGRTRLWPAAGAGSTAGSDSSSASGSTTVNSAPPPKQLIEVQRQLRDFARPNP